MVAMSVLPDTAQVPEFLNLVSPHQPWVPLSPFTPTEASVLMEHGLLFR